MTIDQAKRRQSLARWHRRLALFIAAWLVVLAASGMVINHAHDFGLDRSPLPGFLQRLVYGIEAPGESPCSPEEARAVDCNGIFARLSLPAGSLLLSRDALFLLDDSGRLIEKLIAGQLGLGRLQAGLLDGPRIYLRDDQHTVQTDADLMEADVLGPEAAGALDGRDWQVHVGSADTVSWERLLLDLHAARFLGPVARWFNDLMGVLILVLALSGIWLFRHKPRANGNGSNKA